MRVTDDMCAWLTPKSMTGNRTPFFNPAVRPKTASMESQLEAGFPLTRFWAARLG